jgi:hypothetical protein
MQDLSKNEQIALALTTAIVSTLPPSEDSNAGAVERYADVLQLIVDKQKLKRPYAA